MAYFLQTGDAFFPAPSKESLLDGLPLGNYTVEESMDGMYFKRSRKFNKLTRLYGDHERWASRIVQTFKARSGNTGVLLSGEKGSGKSLLGKVLSRDAATEGMPTIIVDKPWSGTSLGPLLAKLTEPALIFMDEFEKVYDSASLQETILTLLDGTSSTKHLFVLTVNDSSRLDQHLKNRPGRLYYSIDFQGLESDFIREFCEDRLKAKEHIEAVVRLASLFDQFNFDMLNSLVDEMNRYGESPAEAVKLLNITPVENRQYFRVTIVDPEGNTRLGTDHWHGNPLFITRHEFQVYPLKEVDEDSDDWSDKREKVVLTANDLIGHDAVNATYSFQKEGWVVTMIGNPTYRLSAGHWAGA